MIDCSHPSQNGTVRPGTAQLGDDVGIEQVHDNSIEARYWPPPMPATRWHLEIATAFIGEQKLLERPRRSSLQPTPLGNRNQHGSFLAALGHKLRALLEAGLKQFAEARFCVLDRPRFHVVS